MGIIHALIRWYRLNHGIGKAMDENGAELVSCPYCGNETYVYRSQYNDIEMPTVFSVCLWCDGIIESGKRNKYPSEPFGSRERRAERGRSK